MQLHVHVHIHKDDEAGSNGNENIIGLLNKIINKLNKMGTDLTDLTAKVENNGTVIGSAVVLLQGLKAALDAAGTDPVKLKALSDSLGNNTQSLSDAIVANTPAEQ